MLAKKKAFKDSNGVTVSPSIPVIPVNELAGAFNSKEDKSKTENKVETKQKKDFGNKEQNSVFSKILKIALLAGGVSLASGFLFWYGPTYLRWHIFAGSPKIEKMDETIVGDQKRLEYKFKMFNWIYGDKGVRYSQIKFLPTNDSAGLPSLKADDISKNRLYVYDNQAKELCIYYDDNLEYMGKYGEIKVLFNNSEQMHCDGDSKKTKESIVISEQLKRFVTKYSSKFKIDELKQMLIYTGIMSSEELEIYTKEDLAEQDLMAIRMLCKNSQRSIYFDDPETGDVYQAIPSEEYLGKVYVCVQGSFFRENRVYKKASAATGFGEAGDMLYRFNKDSGFEEINPK